jgi:GNAT superfamily N-acetyltransferase
MRSSGTRVRCPPARRRVAVVDRSHHGRGLSRLLVEAMRDLARGAGFASLIAPVRPTWKDRYPLIPMERYVRFPEDGDYVVPGALVPVSFADGHGVYVEPNVWMRHAAAQ